MSRAGADPESAALPQTLPIFPLDEIGRAHV